MHPEEHYFLEVLHRLNWPRWARLIYADWLDEHGQEEHALEIREQVLGQLIEIWYGVPPLPDWHPRVDPFVASLEPEPPPLPWERWPAGVPRPV